MNIITITDMAAFKAAVVCTDKKETRTYLTGVEINTREQTVTGSDGKRFFSASCVTCDEYTGDEKAIVKLESNIPTNVMAGYLDFDNMIGNFFTKRGDKKLIPFSIVNSVYPIFSCFNKLHEGTGKFSVCSRYIHEIEKAVGARGTEFRLFCDHNNDPTLLKLSFINSELLSKYEAAVMLMRA